MKCIIISLHAKCKTKLEIENIFNSHNQIWNWLKILCVSEVGHISWNKFNFTVPCPVSISYVNWQYRKNKRWMVLIRVEKTLRMKICPPLQYINKENIMKWETLFSRYLWNEREMAQIYVETSKSHCLLMWLVYGDFSFDAKITTKASIYSFLFNVRIELWFTKNVNPLRKILCTVFLLSHLNIWIEWLTKLLVCSRNLYPIYE